MKKLFFVMVALTLLLAQFCSCARKADPVTTSESESSEEESETKKAKTKEEPFYPREDEIEPEEPEIDDFVYGTDGTKLNLKLLSTIGMTYSQVRGTYGELIEAKGSGIGSIYYYFENGYGFHIWNTGQRPDADFVLPTDENGKVILEKIPLPEPQDGCYYIGNLKAEDLFFGLSQATEGQRIEEIYGVKFFGNGPGPEGYASSFQYKQKNVYISIWVHTGEDGMIDPDSKINMKYSDIN